MNSRPTAQKVLSNALSGVMGTPPFPMIQAVDQNGAMDIAQAQQYRHASLRPAHRKLVI